MEQQTDAEIAHGNTKAISPEHPFFTIDHHALKETLVKYEIAAASERQARDAMIACWRDYLHATLKQVGPIDPKDIHELINTMDNMLNRAGGRRK